MPVSIKGSGSGSVTLDAGAASADTTLTIPNVTGTVLQSGTAVTVAQGGTGLATLTAANNALYSTSSSAMTAGTLPAAAGGTGLTAPGTSGNILTSNGTAWTSAAPAAGGVTSIVAGTGISVSGTTAVTVNVVTTLGAVGTYGFFVYSGGAATISPGTTYAGSLLYYSSNIPAGCDLYALIKNSATNPSGTWRAMGGWNSASTLLQTLFVRIS